MSGQFTQRGVNKIFGHIPSRTLRWWGLMGLYECSEEVRDGRGISRFYSLDNLYQIGIVEELTSLNIPIRVIKEIMEDHFHFFRHEVIEDGEWDSDRIMKEILTITRNTRILQLGKQVKPASGWRSWLIRAIEEAEMDPTETVLILLDLKKIKAWVDSAVN